jgi:hypothetical protein
MALLQGAAEEFVGRSGKGTNGFNNVGQASIGLRWADTQSDSQPF